METDPTKKINFQFIFFKISINPVFDIIIRMNKRATKGMMLDLKKNANQTDTPKSPIKIKAGLYSNFLSSIDGILRSSGSIEYT